MSFSPEVSPSNLITTFKRNAEHLGCSKTK